MKIENNNKIVATPKELNNLSRKGLYVYVKEKGNKGRYYKFQLGTEMQDYIDIYQGNKTLATTKERRSQAQKSVRKVKEKKKIIIEDHISKGISTEVIKNANQISTNKFKGYRKKILDSLVKDKSLLDTLSTDENFKKLNKRIEYRVQFKDNSGNILSEVSLFNVDMNNLESKLKSIDILGKEISGSYENSFKDIIKYHFNKNPSVSSDGVVNSVDIKMIFRKGDKR